LKNKILLCLFIFGITITALKADGLYYTYSLKKSKISSRVLKDAIGYITINFLPSRYIGLPQSAFQKSKIILVDINRKADGFLTDTNSVPYAQAHYMDQPFIYFITEYTHNRAKIIINSETGESKYIILLKNKYTYTTEGTMMPIDIILLKKSGSNQKMKQVNRNRVDPCLKLPKGSSRILYQYVNQKFIKSGTARCKTYGFKSIKEGFLEIGIIDGIGPPSNIIGWIPIFDETGELSVFLK